MLASLQASGVLASRVLLVCVSRVPESGSVCILLYMALTGSVACAKVGECGSLVPSVVTGRRGDLIRW